LLALYTLKFAVPLMLVVDDDKMIEALSRSSGNAFCTVNRHPLDVIIEYPVKVLLGNCAQGQHVAAARATARSCSISAAQPAVIFGRGVVVANPTPDKVARLLGLNLDFQDDEAFDVLIVVVGPAGVAAGVYAGASSRIENLHGVPHGNFWCGPGLTRRGARSPMRELRPPGSVRGAFSNERPYRDIWDKSLDGTSASTRRRDPSSGDEGIPGHGGSRKGRDVTEDVRRILEIFASLIL
jgi:hypothetical protein